MSIIWLSTKVDISVSLNVVSTVFTRFINHLESSELICGQVNKSTAHSLMSSTCEHLWLFADTEYQNDFTIELS